MTDDNYTTGTNAGKASSSNRQRYNIVKRIIECARTDQYAESFRKPDGSLGYTPTKKIKTFPLDDARLQRHFASAEPLLGVYIFKGTKTRLAAFDIDNHADNETGKSPLSPDEFRAKALPIIEGAQ